MFFVLLAFWLIFNGRFTLEILLVGVVVCAVLTFAWRRIFHTKRNALFFSPRAVWSYLRYLGSLVIEIIRCNFQVMRLILHPGAEVHPQLRTFRLRIKDPGRQTLLANSITLTPGTITVGLRDDLIRVHALDQSFMEGIESCDMVTRLEKIEEARKNA